MAAMWIMWFIRRFPAGEPVAADLAAGGFDGGGAGPGREPVAVGEAGGDDRSDAG